MSYQRPPDYEAGAAGTTNPPGWYLDPIGLQSLRWWDGAQWARDTQPLLEPAWERPCERTWYLGGRPERAIGVAGPLADLAALVPRGLPGIPGPLQLGCTMGTVPCFSAISRLSPQRLGQAGHHPADRRRPGCRKLAGKQTETGRKRNGNRPGGDRCPLIDNSLIDGSPTRRPAYITAQPGHHHPSQRTQSRRVTA